MSSTSGPTDPSGEHRGRDLVLHYLDRQTRTAAEPTATERSLYPELQQLFQALATRLPGGSLKVLTEARAEGVGVPDLRVSGADGRAVGSVEVKPPGCSLEELQHSEQIRRYAAAFPNLLLTDGFRFRLLRQGEEVMAAGRTPALATEDLHEAGAAARQAAPEVGELLAAFLAYRPEPCSSLKELVAVLAGHARRLQSAVEHQVKEERQRDTGRLAGLMEAFTHHLMPDLSVQQFADLYAQTLTYGLLAGRWWSTAGDPAAAFDRQIAWDAISPNLGLLRDLYRYVLFGDPPSAIRWILDDLVDLLATTDLPALFRQARRRDRDPVLLFYEDFLRRYRPDQRRRRGVFYTPGPLVTFIVRSVDRLLEEELGYRGGLAHPQVTVLDPAAGTLTFLVEAVHRAQERFAETYGPAARLGPEILDRFFGFELLVAPYALGHLKMGTLMEELGSPLTEGQRFGLYLTNTLELEPPEQSRTPGTGALAEEAGAALEVKHRPMTVILGNPPYFGHAANHNRQMEGFLRRGYERADGTWADGYYTVQGRPLDEKNSKWLRDDYVQFFRFAQWKMDQADHGLVAFVTNHSFLDNPTFRGMRESLLESFDRIWVLDLHGNTKKKEEPAAASDPAEGVTVVPEGVSGAAVADENVFEIRQGVAVTLMVKHGSRRGGDGEDPAPPAPRLRRHDLWGSKAAKEAWLAEHDVGDVAWRPVEPYPPGFYFLHRDRRLEERYRRFPAIDDVFQLGSLGLITGLDELVVDVDHRRLLRRIERFHHATRWEDARQVLEDLKLSGRARKRLPAAWRACRGDARWRERILPFLVRPFDHRHLFYAPYLLERPREDVMEHLLAGANRALVVSRQAKRNFGVFVTSGLTGHKVLDSYDGSYVFPLYRTPRADSLYAGDPEGNFEPALIRALGELWGEPPHPEALFHYLYAVLHAEPWRRRYGEFLETGFPRVPLPRGREPFRRLSLAGEALAREHLLQAAHDQTVARFEGAEPGTGGAPRIVERRRDLRYRAEEERLVITRDGGALVGVPEAVWQARIGSHRPLLAWLDARRGQPLGADDVRLLCHMVTALEHCRPHQAEIDRLVPGIEDDPAPLPTPLRSGRPTP